MKSARNVPQRACARKSPFFRFLIREKELEDDFILPDLQDMILQRAPAEQLKEIARVRKNWRSYIKENSKKMRRHKVYRIGLSDPSHALIEYAKDEDEDEGHRESEIIEEDKIITSDDLWKFSPEVLNLPYINDTENLSSQLQNLPDWWLVGIKKVSFVLTEDFPLSFFQRFSCIDEICLRDDNIRLNKSDEKILELIKAFIKSSPATKKFKLHMFNFYFNGSILDTIIEKSQSYPTEFPIVFRAGFTAAEVIKFLKLNEFPDAASHRIHIWNLIEKENEMQEWIQVNTTIISPPPVRRAMMYSNPPPIEIEFIFCGMKFAMKITRRTSSD